MLNINLMLKYTYSVVKYQQLLFLVVEKIAKTDGGLNMPKEIIGLFVNGMSCSHCENSIKKAVGALNGVGNVNVDLGLKKVTIEFDPERVDLKTIKDTIEDQGYDVK